MALQGLERCTVGRWQQQLHLLLLMQLCHVPIDLPLMPCASCPRSCRRDAGHAAQPVPEVPPGARRPVG